MKNTEIDTLLKEVKEKYQKIQKIVNKSLMKFSKNNQDLKAFLFGTILGEAVRSKIARHLFDNAMLRYTQHETKKLPLQCGSVLQAARIHGLLEHEDLVKHIKSEFSCLLIVSREPAGRVIVEFQT